MKEQALPPAVDLSILPSHLQGQWVLLLIDGDEQRVVSSGTNVREVVRDQPTGPDYLLTRVPHEVATFVVRDES